MGVARVGSAGTNSPVEGRLLSGNQPFGLISHVRRRKLPATPGRGKSSEAAAGIERIWTRELYQVAKLYSGLRSDAKAD